MTGNRSKGIGLSNIRLLLRTTSRDFGIDFLRSRLVWKHFGYPTFDDNSFQSNVHFPISIFIIRYRKLFLKKRNQI